MKSWMTISIVLIITISILGFMWSQWRIRQYKHSELERKNLQESNKAIEKKIHSLEEQMNQKDNR
jgi:sensor domain CHASE-containing protein